MPHLFGKLVGPTHEEGNASLESVDKPSIFVHHPNPIYEDLLVHGHIADNSKVEVVESFFCVGKSPFRSCESSILSVSGTACAVSRSCKGMNRIIVLRAIFFLSFSLNLFFLSLVSLLRVTSC